MPRKLITNLLLKIGISDIESLSPSSVYNLSLRMGTSYEATVNRLAVLKIIKPAKYGELKISPIEIKKEYGTRNIMSNWNNIWVLSKDDTNSTIYPIVGDEIRIMLEENPSTGYKWVLEPNLDKVCTYWEPIHDNYDMFGAKGIRTIILKIEDDKEFKLNLYHNRPWLPLMNAISNFSLYVLVQKKRHGISKEQLIA